MAKIAFTAGRVSAFICPADKAQAFMWDAIAAGLGLRTTPAGKPAYVFQRVYQGKDLRLTIGNPGAWTIKQARDKARALQRLIDDGKDPRDLKRDALAHQAEREANAAAQAEANKLTALTVGEVWATYIAGAARTGATCMTATMSTKPNPVACRLGDVVVGRS